tara:strand:- start:734 stop:916 length:183 start_codon:yes stop_codon:yes gene_type:complete
MDGSGTHAHIMRRARRARRACGGLGLARDVLMSHAPDGSAFCTSAGNVSFAGADFFSYSS